MRISMSIELYTMPHKLPDEFTKGWQGPSVRFSPLEIPTLAGKSALPPHIELSDPFALFKLLIPLSMLIDWVRWSNEYAAEVISASYEHEFKSQHAYEHAHEHAHEHAYEHSHDHICAHKHMRLRDHIWRDLEIGEMYILLAVIIG
jgi:hypothetical protein